MASDSTAVRPVTGTPLEETKAPEVDFMGIMEREINMPTDKAPDPTFFKDHVYKIARDKDIKVPWDVEAHQSALGCVVQLFQGRVLDCGCGLGNNTIWLASLDRVTNVVGIDISEDALATARSRQAAAAPEVASKVTFMTGDVFDLPMPQESFDVLLDSAVFHCIGDDDAQRRYLASVTPRIKVGGRAVMLAMSDANPDPWCGPRRISRDHATALWTAAGWRVDRIDDASFDMPYRMKGNAGLCILMQATRVA